MTQKSSPEFEYNDGLGDMLREKERLEFSWVKTIVAALSIVIAVGAFFVVGFQIAKHFVTHSSTAKKVHTYTQAPITDAPAKVAPVKTPVKATPEKVAEKPVIAAAPVVVPVKEKIEVKQKVAAKIEAKPAPKPAAPATVRPLRRASASQPIVRKSPRLIPHYKVVAGSFATRQEAVQQTAALRSLGVPYFILPVKTAESMTYRVQAGAFGNAAQAAPVLSTLRTHGIQAVLINE